MINPLDIDSSSSTAGVFNATAQFDTFITETEGDLNVGLVQSNTGIVRLVTGNGGIVDADSDASHPVADILATSIDLDASRGGSIGANGNDLDIDSSIGATGRLVAVAFDGIHVTEVDGELNVLAAETTDGDVELSVLDSGATGDDLNVMETGMDFSATMNSFTGRIISSSGFVVLRVGDEITIPAGTLVMSELGIAINIDSALDPDTNDADPDLFGGTITIRGTVRGLVELNGGEDNDLFDIIPPGDIGITVHGNEPTLPVIPGDLLIVEPLGQSATNTVTDSAAGDGFVAVTSFFDINYTSIEMVDLIGINDTPVNFLPDGMPMTDANTSLTFSAANGNKLKVADSDAGVATDFMVTLSVENGTLGLTNGTGLTVTGNGSPAVPLTIAGMLDDINAALESGLVYTPESSLVAFPGAEGFGRFARGGRGGDVYHVENLNNDGPGSFREGIKTAEGPRTIVFDVSGTIFLESDLRIDKPYITVAGETAPGGGITLAGDRFLIAYTHDVIVRYLRSRPGDILGSTQEPETRDALGVFQSTDVILDHVSGSWSTDEVFASTGPGSLTIQWSISAEGLNESFHPKGSHSDGSLNVNGNLSLHHNLFVSNNSRNPKVQQFADVVNNVVYNFGIGGLVGYAGGDDPYGPTRVNFEGNYYIAGPDTSGGSIFLQRMARLYEEAEIWTKDNFVDFDRNGILDGTLATFANLEIHDSDSSPEGIVVEDRFDYPRVTTSDAATAYEQVLAQAGASLVRDPVDLRLIDEVMRQMGQNIDSQDEVGGWPALASGEPPLDSDRDGLPDDWENSQNLDPHDPGDRNLDDDGNGYTELEEYLHFLANGLAGDNHHEAIQQAAFAGTDTLTIFSQDMGNTGNGGMLTDTDSFEIIINDTLPPTADVADAVNGGTISTTLLNDRRSIDVTFTDLGSGLNPATIDGDELLLGGAGRGTAALTGTPVVQSGTTYRYALTGNFVSGVVTVQFDAGTFADQYGNWNVAEIESFTVADWDAPELTSFSLFNPATSPTNADTLVFQATFDEPVTNVDVADFVVEGTTTAAVSSVAEVDNNTYEVTVSGGDLATFNGEVGLNLSGAQNITDLAGNTLPAAEPITDETYTVDNGPAPQVTNVLVSNANWSAAYRALIPGGDPDGYLIPHGADQTKTLLWSNIREIIVEFSKAVKGSGPDGTLIPADFQLSGINNGVATILSPVEYDPVTNRAKLTMAANLRGDCYLLKVDATTVSDLAGNALDGEFSPHQLGSSGDVVAGVSFWFDFNVMPGDFNRNGDDVVAPSVAVDSSDLSVLGASWMQTHLDPFYRWNADANGDLRNDSSDLSVLGSNWMQSLPTPAPGPLAAAAALAAATSPAAAMLPAAVENGEAAEAAVTSICAVDGICAVHEDEADLSAAPGLTGGLVDIVRTDVIDRWTRRSRRGLSAAGDRGVSGSAADEPSCDDGVAKDVKESVLCCVLSNLNLGSAAGR